MEIILVLSLLAFAIVMFATEKLPVDVTTLIILIILTSTGILTASEAFDGFSSDFIIILSSVFVISSAFQHNGILDLLSAKIAVVTSSNRVMFIVTVMVISGTFSAFLSNTTISALLVPPLISICNRAKIPPGKVLMPMAFASILGGTCTLIGTSTNVAASSFISNSGLEPLSMFEMLPLGVVLLAGGIAFFALGGTALLPKREDKSFTEKYGMRQYLTEIRVQQDSPLIGQRAHFSELRKYKVSIVNVIRGNRSLIPDRHTLINENDVLVVEGEINELIKIKSSKKFDLLSDIIEDVLFNTKDLKLVEMVITPKSDIHGHTLKSSNFSHKTGMVVLAVHSIQGDYGKKLSEMILRTGDVLLVQGAPEDITDMKNSDNLMVLEEVYTPNYNKKKGILNIIFFLGAIIAASIEIVPLPIAFLIAALLTVLAQRMEAKRVYGSIDWRLLILIGGMTAFGTAMHKTGADVWLADGIINILEGSSPLIFMAAFMVLTVILTQPLSNAAAAMVVLPVALQVAETLQVDQRSFAMAIIFSASISLVTPFEPACLLVYGPGKYKVKDFLKTGGILTFILLIIAWLILPILWPL